MSKTLNNISLGDFSRIVGYSKTTVSVILNGKADKLGICENTIKHVISEAKRLNYKPNLFARALRLGKSTTIGVILADISNPFYAKLARKIEDEASYYKYSVLFSSSDESPEKESKIIDTLRYRHVDGLIIVPTQNDTSDYKNMIDDNFSFVVLFY